MISGEEFERRIRRVSQLRAITITLRRAAQQAYDEGRSPYKHAYDIRSDYDYWKRLLDERLREQTALGENRSG